jgi:hypothetical protein
LCTRSISAGSFTRDDSGRLAVGLAEAALLVGVDDADGVVVATTAAVGVGVGAVFVTASCVDRRPTIPSPRARTTTSANGRSVRAVEARRMTRRYGFLATVTTAKIPRS